MVRECLFSIPEKLELAYTRNGAINVRQDGKLVNSDGIAYLDKYSRDKSTFRVVNAESGTKSFK